MSQRETFNRLFTIIQSWMLPMNPKGANSDELKAFPHFSYNDSHSQLSARSCNTFAKPNEAVNCASVLAFMNEGFGKPTPIPSGGEKFHDNARVDQVFDAIDGLFDFFRYS